MHRLAPQDVLVGTRVRVTVISVGANSAGAVLVFLYLFVVLPPPGVGQPGLLLAANVAGFLVGTPFAMAVGAVASGRYLRRLRAWVEVGAPPGPLQRTALAYPAYLVRLNAALWAAAAVLFSVLNVPFSGVLARDVLLSIGVAGLASSAATYLLVDRSLRPLSALALAAGLPDRQVAPGIRARVLVGWLVAALLPLGGTLIAVVASPQHVPARTVLSAAFIGGTGLVAGLVATLAAARSVAEPVESLRRAVAAVGAGDLAATVEVYDGSELGRLQAGFNDMVGGLRERERLADLFGRQVGQSVAARALARGVELGGERRTVGVLFVDVVGSTAMAMNTDPEEVVRRLNAFFAVVVEVVTGLGGLVNKFEGDAVLAVFGAPVELPDAAGSAVAAASLLARRLRGGELTAAVGVSYGPVVAGNVGTEHRYEYTVVGDAANEAARLSELAKSLPSLLLASGAAVAAAGATGWDRCGAQVLRGRSAPTELFTYPLVPPGSS